LYTKCPSLCASYTGLSVYQRYWPSYKVPLIQPHTSLIPSYPHTSLESATSAALEAPLRLYEDSNRAVRLYYVRLHYVRLCYVRLYYVRLYYVRLYYVRLYYVRLYYVRLYEGLTQP
jgi:hypothetical protein